MRARPDSQRIVGLLLDAYRQGVFPMADPDTGQVGFYTSGERGVFPLHPGGFHVPRRLARIIRSHRFEVTSDTAFDEVVQACAEPRPGEPDTWINRDIAQWSRMLFDAGHAHSVEAWATDLATGERALVGGLYGVSLGGAFFGESMFHRARPRRVDGSRDPLDGTDAGNVALALTAGHLRIRGFALFDTQFSNPHIDRFGCVEIDPDDYLKRLGPAADLTVQWAPFDARAAEREILR